MLDCIFREKPSDNRNTPRKMAARNRIGWMIIAIALCAPGSALAQTAPSTPEHVPLQKTIGQAGPDIVPSLIVMNARGASLQGGKLTLTGVAPNSIVFADRPVRAAGHTLTTHLLAEWAPNNESGESFTKDPPNGTVSVFSTDGSKIRDAVVTLKTAKLEGDKLTFNEVLLVSKDAGDVMAGAPFVANATVLGEVAGESRGPKLRVFKKKRRKGFRKTRGHRSVFTRVKITDIQI